MTLIFPYFLSMNKILLDRPTLRKNHLAMVIVINMNLKSFMENHGLKVMMIHSKLQLKPLERHTGRILLIIG